MNLGQTGQASQCQNFKCQKINQFIKDKIMSKINFKITDLTCDACIKLSSLSLKKIPGVKNVEVKSNGSASIEADKEITNEEIIAALAKVDKTAVFN